MSSIRKVARWHSSAATCARWLLQSEVGSYPEGVAITSDSRKAYVANWFSDDISVIDLVAAKEIGRIKCAPGPRAISARQIIRTDDRM